MNFIIRNLEALGDEVAAALDDLADEVTGRNNGTGRCRDGADDDGPSDDASDRSVTSGDPQWHGASDAGGSDTASCNSDGGGGICPATSHTPAVPPRPERMSDGPAAAGPSPSTVPVKPPGSGLRRRKAPRIDASKLPAEEGEDRRVEAPAPRPSKPSSSQPRDSPPREPPQQTQAPPRDVSAAATHSPALDAKPPKPAALGVPPASQQQEQQQQQLPPAQSDPAKPPAKAPKAVKRRPPVVPPRPTPAPSGTAVAAASAADTSLAPVASRAVPPPQPQLPQPPAQTLAKQMHARAPSGSSAFDLCDGSPDGVATPTEDGEYLLL